MPGTKRSATCTRKAEVGLRNICKKQYVLNISACRDHATLLRKKQKTSYFYYHMHRVPLDILTGNHQDDFAGSSTLKCVPPQTRSTSKVASPQFHNPSQLQLRQRRSRASPQAIHTLLRKSLSQQKGPRGPLTFPSCRAV